ncbi:sensor histidine kinase [Flammeovirga aprica]|uniref:Histidine kinase n=1 Tax=Flammeovirga aprica JL-4 TaxID=694437 RepID=A0A7X9XBA0_9BACT|nr:sensor histidine kinase [Flammeovirga aprica]NME70424.1 histidine kinase [Flammeovirga aprica JL-4]
MNNKIIKYGKSAIIGSTITGLLSVIMMSVGIIITPITETEEFTVALIFWSLLVSFITHHFAYLKKKIPVLMKLAGLLLFLIFINLYDEATDMPENPVMIILVVILFNGLVYTILPKFFLKYYKHFWGYFGGVFLFVYVFQGNDDTVEHFEKVVRMTALTTPVLFGLWIYEQWKWLQTLKNEKARAELQLLKSQINPHFFFNTLNNLYGLTVEKSDKAPEVVLKLGDMMRYTIYEGKEEKVDIQNEITYLENYIELHKIRYQKNVQIHFINSVISDFKIAPLLYIILLENAFKHGVETLVENAYIFVEIEELGTEVRFSIENNYDKALIDHRIGIGLDNLKKRLELIYPNRHHLEFVNTIDTYKAILTIDLA